MILSRDGGRVKLRGLVFYFLLMGQLLIPQGRRQRRSLTSGIDVGHVLWAFLPRSETFIATELDAHRDLSQVILARHRADFDFLPRLPFATQGASWPGAFLGPAYDRGASLLGMPMAFDYWLRRTVRRLRPRLLHARFGWAGTSALLAARDARLPLVTGFYGLDVYAPAVSAGPWRRAYPQLFADGALFTCVGPRAMAHLIEIGCPRPRVRIVPIGLDLDTFPFVPRELSPSPTVIQIGRMIPKKGFDLTVRAFGTLVRDVPDARLRLVGDGPERPAIEALVGELGLGAKVRFFGALPAGRVRELVFQSHVGIQPSRTAPNGDREGTPTVLLEFQAAGLDVVATRHADIPWIVADAARLADENDVDALAIALLDACTATEPERRARLVAGRSLVEQRHDAAKIAHSLRGIYRDAEDYAASL